MRYSFTKRFIGSYHDFFPDIQSKFNKQLRFLLQDLKYPSLKAKKYNEETGIWQGRVDRNIRFYFLIQDDVYVLLDIKRHPK